MSFLFGGNVTNSFKNRLIYLISTFVLLFVLSSCLQPLEHKTDHDATAVVARMVIDVVVQEVDEERFCNSYGDLFTDSELSKCSGEGGLFNYLTDLNIQYETTMEIRIKIDELEGYSIYYMEIDGERIDLCTTNHTDQDMTFYVIELD